MDKLIGVVGNIAAIVGLLLCIGAGASRLSGAWLITEFEVMTIFDVGVGVMVAAALAKLYSLARLR